jgi:conjugative transposon TraM protein
MKQHTDKFLQKRRFYMVLPALVVPFLTMIFWALGGGQGVPAQAKTVEYVGLNLALPDAHFDEREIWDKLSLYEMAERDSAKYEEARESDPYFDLIAFKSNQEMEIDTTRKDGQLIDSFKQKDRLSADPNEERVNKKLQELYSELNKSATPSIPTATSSKQSLVSSSDPQFTTDVDRLEQMMEMMHGSGEPDPEMQQIEDVLEKILDIQHPERVKEKLNGEKVQQRDNAFSVETVNNDNISIIPQTPSTQSTQIEPDSTINTQTLFISRPVQNGFYGLEDEIQVQQEVGNAIDAIIHDTQELVAGATVKMRLLNEVTINGKVISKDQFIYGTCGINGERLTIEINSIRSGNSLLPVSLSVYDLDGLEGIYIPGAITRDAAKQASDNALQNIQLMSLDPTIGQQAASAGIEAAKGLLSKKAKLVKVTVKAGYKILLMDKV